MARRTEVRHESSFESDMQRLEEIVDQLEQGAVPLEESLKMYEEGIALSKRCVKRLNQAETKLQVLRKEVQDDMWDQGNTDEA